MAFNEKQYLDLLGLQKYDALVKQYIGAGDAALKAALDAEVARATQAEGALAADLQALDGRLDTAESNITDITKQDGVIDTKVAALKTTLEGDAESTKDSATIAGAKKYADDKVATLDGELKTVAKSGKAEDVTVADVEGKLDATNVEAALKEIISKVEGVQTAGAVTVVKDADAGEYAAIYHVQQNGKNVGVPINVPKDYLVKSAQIKECTEIDVPAAGLQVGDKYIDFVINSMSGQGNESHIYLRIQDLIDDFTVAANAAEVQLAVSPTREVSATLVNGGVSTDKIADKAVTLAKLSEDLQNWKAGIDSAIGEGGSVAEQIAAAVSAEATLRETVDNALGGRLNTAETNITRIDGDNTVEGSFRKAVKDEADRAIKAETDIYNAITSIPEASITALFETKQG